MDSLVMPSGLSVCLSVCRYVLSIYDLHGRQIVSSNPTFGVNCNYTFLDLYRHYSPPTKLLSI